MYIALYCTKLHIKVMVYFFKNVKATLGTKNLSPVTCLNAALNC